MNYRIHVQDISYDIPLSKINKISTGIVKDSMITILYIHSNHYQMIKEELKSKSSKFLKDCYNIIFDDLLHSIKIEAKS